MTAYYDVDKLMVEARRLAAEYRRATGKPLGISSEIAVHDVARIMDLDIASSNQGGYDAIGRGEREGKRIQIKGRSITEEAKSSQRLGQMKLEQDWDSVMVLFMDDNYEPVEIYEAERDKILEAVKNTSNKRKNRGAVSVKRFKVIGRLVWSKSQGLC